MVPLVGIKYEFNEQEKIIRETAAKLFEETGDSIDFKVGTMLINKKYGYENLSCFIHPFKSTFFAYGPRKGWIL